MRKSLLIGLVVCLLALGGIGAAFATGMGFSNVGALSAGGGNIPQVNTTYVGYNVKADGVSGEGTWYWPDTSVTCPVVESVDLIFDRGLSAGTEVWVFLVENAGTLQSPNDDTIRGGGHMTLGAYLPAGSLLTVPLNDGWADIYEVRFINEVQVVVFEK